MNDILRHYSTIEARDCTYASWLAGYGPSLALDAGGNPCIAADSLFVASGRPDGAEDLHTGVRVVYFNQGSTPGRNRVFVSLVRT
jgi:hypothetical protein